jgi:hypothetical protein
MKLLQLFFLSAFVSSVGAFAVSSPSSRSRYAATRSSTKLKLYNSVEAAIADAQRICLQDPSCHECKVAWDVVEELEAASSRRGAVQANPTIAQPDVAALMASFDILIQKIDGKMDQLKATTVKFHEMGASDPSIEALYNRADEMKAALVDARKALPR